MRSWLRLGWWVPFSLSACTFQVGAVGPPPFEADLSFVDAPVQPGQPDLARSDGAPPDMTMSPPDMTMLPMPDMAMPDMALPPPPVVTLKLDARSPNLFAIGAQPKLMEYGTAVGHYLFNEATGPVIDSTNGMNNLLPVGNGFSGNRPVFTWIPAANGGGFTRTATEFKGAGFSASTTTAFDVTREDFTIEAWFKIPPGYSATSNANCDPIAIKYANTTGYEVCVGAGGKLALLDSAGGGMVSGVTSTIGFDDGAWHLGTFVFGVSTANTGAIFVDGRDFTGNAKDLSVPMGKSLSNGGAFTVGGLGVNNPANAFHGALAELVFHDNKLESLAEHQANYRAFGVPITASPADVTYAHDSDECTIVADDPMTGDRVACYAGGNGLAPQLVIVRNPNASLLSNPGQLGMLLASASVNYAVNSEVINSWSQGAGTVKVMPENAISPRGDQTAETVALGTKSSLELSLPPLAGNGVVIFSIWLRGQDGTQVFMRLTDPMGVEVNHCLVSLSSKWRRKKCVQAYTKSPMSVTATLDNLMVNGDMVTVPAVTFDAWGAQIEELPPNAFNGLGATPYVPNVQSSSALRAGINLSIKNGGARYLNGGAGNVQITFTGADAMKDGTYLFDTLAPNDADRHYLGRDTGATATAEILDANGQPAADSQMRTNMLDWSATRFLALAWSAVSPLPNSTKHTSLNADMAQILFGRAAAYNASSPNSLFIGSTNNGGKRSDGALHLLTIFDRP